MGEAKRRKELDPTYGRSVEFTTKAVFEHILKEMYRIATLHDEPGLIWFQGIDKEKSEAIIIFVPKEDIERVFIKVALAKEILEIVNMVEDFTKDKVFLSPSGMLWVGHKNQVEECFHE
jgi:hypothetical protein